MPLWPLGVYTLTTVIIVGGMLGISALLGQRHRGRATVEPFESGMPPTGTPYRRFPVSFYVMALLFLIFDLETVLFVSWAIGLRDAGWSGFVEILVVTAILLAALAYLWRRGALSWAPQPTQENR